MIVLVVVVFLAAIEFHVPRRPRAIVERVAANMVTLEGCVCGRSREKQRDGVEIMAGRCRCKWQWRREGRDDETLQFNDAHVPKYSLI